MPGFVDSIVMNFSLWGPLHSCLPACLPALGFVCCSAHSTAVCRKVHSTYWSHAVTPLFAPQLSAILHSCPLWDPILVCLLHSYIYYHLPSIATALKLHRRIDLISCRLRTVRNHTLKSTSKNLKSSAGNNSATCRSPDYGSGWGGRYKCPSPQDELNIHVLR